MLANCYSFEELSREDCPRTQSGNIRKHSYFNHPCSIWVRKSLSNFKWLVNHASAMCNEKEFRTGKPHFTSSFILWCVDNLPNLPDNGSTPVARAINQDVYGYIHEIADDVEAYREYYRNKRVDKRGRHIDVWTKRERPFWFDKKVT